MDSHHVWTRAGFGVINVDVEQFVMVCTHPVEQGLERMQQEPQVLYMSAAY